METSKRVFKNRILGKIYTVWSNGYFAYSIAMLAKKHPKIAY